jgi:hypothetical protein
VAQGDGPRPSRRAYQIDWALLSRIEVLKKWSEEGLIRTFYVDARGAVLSKETALFLPAAGRKVRTGQELLKYSRIRVYPRPPQLRGRKK